MDRTKDLHPLVPERIRILGNGRLHGKQRDDLEQVVLDHVADRADVVVEPPPALDTEGLSHGDLDPANVVPIPHGFEHGVGETEDHEVLDRFLAEEVVDPVHAFLAEVSMHDVVQGIGGGGIAPEWLLEHDPPRNVEACVREPFDDLVEQRGRNREIRHRTPRTIGSLGDVEEGLPVAVVTRHVAQVACKTFEDRVIDVDAGLLERTARLVPEGLIVPRPRRDTDDRYVTDAFRREIVQGREEPASSEITGNPEQDERVGGGRHSTKVAGGEPVPMRRLGPDRGVPSTPTAPLDVDDAGQSSAR